MCEKIGHDFYFTSSNIKPRTEMKSKTAILAWKAKKMSILQIVGTAEKNFYNSTMF